MQSMVDDRFDYNYNHDVAIMPIVKNVDHFNKWLLAVKA